MQTLNPMVMRDRTSHKRNQRAPLLAESCDPANSSGEDPRGQDAGSLIEGDGVHGPEEHANEGGDEPDGELEAGGRGFEGLRRVARVAREVDVPEGNEGVNVRRAALAYPFVHREEENSSERQT